MSRSTARTACPAIRCIGIGQITADDKKYDARSAFRLTPPVRDLTIDFIALSLAPEKNRTFVNRAWLEYTGMNPEQASGSGWEKAIHPDDLKRVQERWRGAQRAGELTAYEVRVRRADGVYRWFLTRARPLLDKHGKVVKWCAVATDIEDRKRAEQLQADLAHVNRVSTLGELAASISHEFTAM